LQIINTQKEALDFAYSQITDSIDYAKNIQDSILEKPESILSNFSDGFIFYKPKDVVSGDFYWYASTVSNNNEEGIDNNTKIVYAAIDCTGHGVPGGFMSMIGNNLLRKIVKEKNITSPEQILEDLHQDVVEILKQHQGNNRDGMDMTIVSIDKQNKALEFAGAKNPLWYLQEGALFEIRGDTSPVGGDWQGDIKERSFTKHHINIEKPTTFYMFSDGFQDQFGGKKGKKFMRGRFKKLLLNIHQKPFEEQEKILEKTLQDWKGTQEQIDDIMILGFKIDV